MALLSFDATSSSSLSSPVAISSFGSAKLVDLVPGSQLLQLDQQPPTPPPIQMWAKASTSKFIGLIALPNFGMYFLALIEFGNNGCGGLMAFSGVALTSLEELKLKDCVGLNVMLDLNVFPRLEILNLKGLSTFISSAVLTALQMLDLTNCTRLEAILDLGMFPSFKEFSLNGCKELLALSSNVTCLIALTTLDIMGYNNLNGKILCQLQAFYPNAKITLEKMVARRNLLYYY